MVLKATQTKHANVRPAAQYEMGMPSRVQRRRKGLRLEVQGLLKAEVWCTVHRVDFQDLVDSLLRTFLAAQLPVIKTPSRKAKRAPSQNVLSNSTVEEGPGASRQPQPDVR